ncbi:unnamed protein product [Paramecium sonneborni]|uniref:Tetratricopeptide repeat protein n=1 Tax=Paramecium sonneborni TaxID=65129 RepID=A0A8S1JV11_9CILI|nr:unnamed protein product [Paramecium sonneborni]
MQSDKSTEQVNNFEGYSQTNNINNALINNLNESQSNQKNKIKSSGIDQQQNQTKLLKQINMIPIPCQIQRLNQFNSQPLAQFPVLNIQQIPFYGHFNKIMNDSNEEEEKQQEFEVQYGNQNDDFTSAQKTKILLDSESTQPTQKIQLDLEQDPIIQYQKSFDEATFLKNQGNQSFKQQNYVKAIEQYNLASEYCDPDYLIRCPQQLLVQFKKLRISIFLHLSSCYLNIGNPKQCIYHANMVIKLDPLNPEVWFKRALAHQQQFDYENAYRDIEEAWNLVKTTTQDPEIFNKRKQILCQKENLTESQQIKQLSYNGKISKTNQSESKQILSDFYKNSSYSSRFFLTNRNFWNTNIIWKITASAILATWMSQYFFQKKLLSRNGLIQAVIIRILATSSQTAGKKWQKLTLATFTLGVVAIAAIIFNKKKYS